MCPSYISSLRIKNLTVTPRSQTPRGSINAHTMVWGLVGLHEPSPRVCISIHPEGESYSDLGRVLVPTEPPARVLARDKFMVSRRDSWVNRPCLSSLTLLSGAAR